MEAVGLFGAINAALFGFSWVVHLVGAIVALVFVVRYKNAASLLALIGFGLPVVSAPVTTAARTLLAQRMALSTRQMVQVMQGINTASSLLGIVGSGCLVAAFWLALKDSRRV